MLCSVDTGRSPRCSPFHSDCLHSPHLFSSRHYYRSCKLLVAQIPCDCPRIYGTTENFEKHTIGVSSTTSGVDGTTVRLMTWCWGLIKHWVHSFAVRCLYIALVHTSIPAPLEERRGLDDPKGRQKGPIILQSLQTYSPTPMLPRGL